VKIKSSIVIAAAAGSAFAPNAQAADLPMKAPAMTAAPAWSWTGLYIGGHLGAAWQRGRTTGAYTDVVIGPVAFDNKANTTGFIGGGQIGYNWQSGIFVYGLEADISGLSGSDTASQVVFSASGFPITMTSSSKIGWLGTVRGRLGATIGGNTLVYATGGLAYGSVTNTHSENFPAAGTLATWEDHSTRTGYAVGGGVEHMFAPHWTVRAEGLYVDLGKTTLGQPNTGICSNGCQPVTFKNEAIIARAAVNYKF